jgi:hypothetical protein
METRWCPGCKTVDMEGLWLLRSRIKMETVWVVAGSAAYQGFGFLEVE